MAMQQHIRNPIEWSWDQLKHTGRAMDVAAHSMDGAWEAHDGAPLAVQRIKAGDLRDVLRKGFEDFGAYRTDVIFLCLFYPIVGIVLARFIVGSGMLQLLFPLVSGFAIIAPFFAVGLYEMSRRREKGMANGWADAFGVATSPALGQIVVMGLLLAALLALWLFVAHFIYLLSFGPEPPESINDFAREVFTTSAGWTMIVVGIGVGFLFALVAAVISVVSFPLLLDRNVGVLTAIRMSVRVVAANPGVMALWGLIIAGGLVLGAIPLLLGLAIVLPVLGHATWHLYRKVLPR
ncbi:MAG: hypothetical protein OJF58_005066 [Enhydrobacter sp.]|jgi:uncharacterized membrane protein|nr:MAG: hypothetical protein OJF58_005066 [Enhydrobacter sp.]